jgi:hypothetical protein
MTRREWLALAASAAGARADAEKLPPVRQITRGPKFHWFGYYDKLEFDPTSRYVLSNQVGFQGRPPRPDDIIQLGMIDLHNDDRWIDLAETSAWCWQQGCMLQWLPGSKTEVIYNDREGGQYVSRILDVKSGRKRTLPGPIYAVSPDAKWAIAPDFRRLADTRPGYGYNGIPDPNRDVPAPDNAGIWKMDLRTGERQLILTFAQAVAVPNPHAKWPGSKHWFNHLLYSPDGSRFIFLHRWKGGEQGERMATRMFTAGADGKDLHVIDDYNEASHFIWRDAKHILAWASRPPQGAKFYLYEDGTGKVEVIAPDVMTVNGHCTYLPGNRWILNDTYPDKQRNQNPYLYDTKTSHRYALGHFHSPPEYKDEFRCDTHPRFSPDGRKVAIDSPHGGEGRQLYLIDISALLKT